MLAIVGTIPDQDFPLVAGEVTLESHEICIQGNRAGVNRGTPALLAAAIKTSEMLKIITPFAYLVGDIGLGNGSRRLYNYLTQHLVKSNFGTIVFHYILPDVDWFNRVMFAVEEMPKRPILVADAGSMYVAKMSGQAPKFDLFTPDAGELAFLADEEAPHPFYTQGFILHEKNNVPSLISMAYQGENASKAMIVKGEKDYICSKGEIVAIIEEPYVEALEAIGGTGDTLTGIVSALIYGGYAIEEASIMAARINRLSGELAHSTPGTQVSEIIRYIPKAFSMALEKTYTGRKL